jgi:hypothetical protein
MTVFFTQKENSIFEVGKSYNCNENMWGITTLNPKICTMYQINEKFDLGRKSPPARCPNLSML